MKTEIDIAFALLRGALFDSSTLPLFHSSTLTSKDWWRLFRLMQQNHVAALTADTVAALDVPREVMIPWLSEQQKDKDWFRYQLEVQEEIVGLMAKHGIETLVLKGTHTAQYYPVPETREFGDLDLYFYDKHDEADALAHKILKVSVGNEAHHHSKYNYRGVTVESHYDFLNTHYPPSNRRYEALLKGLAGNSQLSTLNSQLSTFEILFLLRHMACHFAASRITLRDLVDWALTCRALHDKADWQLIEKTISDYGMTDFVAALNTIAEQRLGLPTPQSLEVSKSQNLEVSKSRSLEVSLEKDLLYGTIADHAADGPARLVWKLRRWRALRWKRRMVFSDTPLRLWLASLTSHTLKPHSLLHKQ